MACGNRQRCRVKASAGSEQGWGSPERPGLRGSRVWGVGAREAPPHGGSCPTRRQLRQIQLYETYRTSKRTYLVLELAARGDLLEHINATSDLRQRPGLEEGEARRLFRQIVSAVAHCHGVGVVHR